MEPNEAVDRVILALCVYREARGEPQLGKIAVAMSVLNRVRRPSWWGSDVLSVLGKKWQYSAMTASGDPNLTVWPRSDDQAWRECLQAAWEVMDGLWEINNPVPGADSYHDISIRAPSWASPEMFVGQIGRLRFFNVDLDYEGES